MIQSQCLPQKGKSLETCIFMGMNKHKHCTDFILKRNYQRESCKSILIGCTLHKLNILKWFCSEAESTFCQKLWFLKFLKRLKCMLCACIFIIDLDIFHQVQNLTFFSLCQKSKLLDNYVCWQPNITTRDILNF